MEPAEISIAAQGGELGGAEVGGVGVSANGVYDVCGNWVSDSLWVTDFYGEGKVAGVEALVGFAVACVLEEVEAGAVVQKGGSRGGGGWGCGGSSFIVVWQFSRNAGRSG